MAKHPWSWLMAVPILLLTACTGGIGDESVDSVIVTVQGLYEKRDLGAPGTPLLPPKKTRYAYAEIVRSSNNESLGVVELNVNGTGSVAIPRGLNVYAVLYADVVVPSASGTGYSLHGVVKNAVPAEQYTASDTLNNVPTWYVTSDNFNTSSSGTITLTALESTANAEAGAFAIADQMVEFAQGIGRMESTLPLPKLFTFWAPTTVTTYPSSNATATASGVLLDTSSGRPMLVNEIRYGGLSNCADAFNDGLLLETYSHALFAYGSLWSTTAQGTRFDALVRGDNDQVYVDPFNASEPTMAFASGFGHFLSSAIRNNPNHYYLWNDGTLDSWSLNTQSATPVGGGEFYGASVAKSMWGVWKYALGGSSTGLTTMWNAANSGLANGAYELGNAPLGCYPTYLVGLTRLASAQGGTAAANAIRAELLLENIGGGNGDVTDANGAYYISSALWTRHITLPLNLSGNLTHNALNTLSAYERGFAQTHLVYHDGGNRAITLGTPGNGLFVELFDGLGYLAYAKAPGSPNTITLSGRPAGNYAVRVRLDPSKTVANTSYTLTIQ